MCGIVGYIKLNGESIIDSMQDQIDSALNSIQHRGPDNQSSVITKNGFLGHTRLSIIDTNSGANQPMSDSTGRWTIVFNGEIYNYTELKKELIAKGIEFHTTSDTEVLLHLLILEGESCLEKLNGFFAFCFYDNKKDSYLIARDRFGIKPLVYHQTSTNFYFGSELRSIITLGIDKQINKNALANYFRFNYIPAPETIFENTYKLIPGHLIKIENNQVTSKKFYNYYPKEKSNDSFEVAKTKVKSLLEESVQKRLVSDVPLGSFLSGGVDSSIIAAIAAKYHPNINTFSIGFKDEPYFDETIHAEKVAKHIGSNHSTFKLSNNDIYTHLNEIIGAIDEPMADSSAINVYILSKRTRENVTVALSGDGADELFSGYNKHHALYWADQKNTKNTLIKTFGGIANIIPQSRQSKWSNIARQISKYNKGLKLSKYDRYLTWASFMKETKVERLVNKNPVYKLPKNNVEDFNDYLYFDFNLVLPNDMLRKVDMMSMANSLEVRTPFLDHNLVEYVFSLPSNYKINSKDKKVLLKEAFKEDLPEEIFTRKKHGFEVPLLKWFKTDLKNELKEVVFNKEKVIEQNILNWDVIEEIEKDLNSSSPKDAVMETWALYVFQKWYEQFMC